MEHRVAALMATEGLIELRRHPELRRTVARLLVEGTLRRVLPGIVVATDPPDRWRLPAALMRYRPDAVITGASAAALTFRRHLPEPVVVSCSLPGRFRPATDAFACSQRRLDPDLIVERHGIRVTCAALTALDLAALDDGAAIDDALRAGTMTLEDLHRTVDLTRGRRGNRVRRGVIDDSRDRPWSAGERRVHRVLRDAGVRGWRTNAPFVVADGRLFYLDIAFPQGAVMVEIDGFRHHRSPADLDRDVTRQNALVLAGWLPYRITWSMLRRPELIVSELSELLASRIDCSMRLCGDIPA